MSGREEDIRPAALKAELAEHLARDRERWLTGRADWVRTACPACDETCGLHLVVRDYPFVECAGCGTVYQSPRPGPAALAEYYRNAESYTFWAERIFPATADRRRKTIARPLAERVAASGCGRGLAVEIGAGSGLVLEELRTLARFDDLVAVEPTPALARTLRGKGFDVRETGWEDAALADLQADAVCAFEVVEHLYDPGAFLAAVRAMLRPGGLLFLSCPNIRGFDFQVLGYDRADNFGLEHMNMFHPDALAALLRRRGFDVFETATPGRLDADLVRQKVLSGALDLDAQPFLRRVLLDEWDRLGGPFQRFLQEQGLSSSMVVTAAARG